MTNHLSENQLEALIQSPDEVGAEERRRRDAHLEECSLCRDHLSRLQKFYESLREELELPPTEHDEDLADKLLARSRSRLALPQQALERRSPAEVALDAYAEVIEPYRRPLVQRIIRYARVHPVRFAGATSLGALALALAIFLVRPTKDTNPTHAKIRDY
ncbi:MAG: hypothetical protein AABZ61_05705, partial [Bacteroidota bacterium]